MKPNTRNEGKSSRPRRPSAGSGGWASRGRPEFRLNPKRQAFFILLAVVGIAIGYGLGLLSKESSQPAGKTETADRVVLHEPQQDLPSGQNPAIVRPYEEPLPKDIIENPVDPGDLMALPTLKVTVETPGTAEPTPQPVTKTLTVPDKEQTKESEPANKPFEQADPLPAKPGNKPETGIEQLAQAVPMPGAITKPIAKIAIIIDDLGIDTPRTARAIKLKGPLTLSFLTYASRLKKQTKAARDAGHELWMHIPMEPGSPDIDPGPNVLLTGLPKEELRASIQWNLKQFSGHVGINNHMGSRFTADLEGIRVVMEELKKRDLMFLDSITSGRSVARKAAREAGVPFIGRNIFIDHLDDFMEIKKRLAEVERLARKSGYAVAIGHPREKTLRVIGPWLDTVESKGFRLVPLSALIKKP